MSYELYGFFGFDVSMNLALQKSTLDNDVTKNQSLEVTLNGKKSLKKLGWEEEARLGNKKQSSPV